MGHKGEKMKYFIIVIAFFLTGCAAISVPVKAKFPMMPETLMIRCPELEKTKEDAKLSEIGKTISQNYTTYYECATKHDAIIEWYKIQKTIYESVK
jgi:starvation-inducible outer membrane lipoprotein